MKVNAANLISAIDELAESKSLEREEIVEALEEALKKAYVKYLGGGDDAVVVSRVDLEKGEIYVAQVRKVVDEVEDDFLEISVEDANAGLKKAKYAVGDDYEEEAALDGLSKSYINALKNINRQKLAESERVALYKHYKDHIGEMMTGTVDKCDDRTVTVNIGRTKIELSRHELIGDEAFRVGDPIKVYIQEVKSAQPLDGKSPKGPQIEATRSSEGFLKRLFEEEIHEVLDGTVIIKAIARKAGVRSKVAVTSNNEDVDATGACIGPGGSRIQKVVSQLGNGKQKEKIDIVNYSPNPGLFIIEACRPAQVLGVEILPLKEGEREQRAIVVIGDGDRPLALGKYKSNVELASKLTGYRIEYVEASEAARLGFEYKTAEAWVEEAKREKEERERAEYLRKSQQEALKRAEEEKKAAALKAEEEAKLAQKAEEPKAEVKPVEVKPEPKAEEPKVEVKPVEKAAVKTTTTLEDLEKELQSSKEKKTKNSKLGKRPRKITEEEVKREVPKPAIEAMPIYTEEELSAIEAEESSAYEGVEGDDDLEEDYSEYDYGYGDE